VIPRTTQARPRAPLPASERSRAAAGTIPAVFNGALRHPGVGGRAGLRGVHRVGEQPAGVGKVVFR